MVITARVLADSVSPAGHRLTTMECTFPRMILAEFNTHRVFSRNSASSRAIPVERVIEQVRDNPYVPQTWTSNQKGMVGGEPLGAYGTAAANVFWDDARQSAIEAACRLVEAGVHKQHVNRLLEPFMWHTVIVSSTEWDNFFKLRIHGAAQPEMQELADQMMCALEGSTPRRVYYGEYHLPLVDTGDWTYFEDERAQKLMIKRSVARCARVSYGRHNDWKTLDEDVALYDRLRAAGHWSPFEHVATPFEQEYYENCSHYPAPGPPGNFTGWLQHRHEVC